MGLEQPANVTRFLNQQRTLRADSQQGNRVVKLSRADVHRHLRGGRFRRSDDLGYRMRGYPTTGENWLWAFGDGFEKRAKAGLVPKSSPTNIAPKETFHRKESAQRNERGDREVDCHEAARKATTNYLTRGAPVGKNARRKQVFLVLFHSEEYSVLFASHVLWTKERVRD
jgi:hypothetical protein